MSFPLRGEITLYSHPDAEGNQCHGVLRDIDTDEIIWEAPGDTVDTMRECLEGLIASAVASAIAMAPYIYGAAEIFSA